MTSLISILRNRDPPTAIEWLANTLGFTRHYVAEENGQIVHAQMRLGNALLMLGPDKEDDRYGMRSPLGLNGTNQCGYIALDGDVDRAHAHAKAMGADITTEPYDTLYGSREFTCRDPEGHVWSIGSYAGEPV